MTPMTPSTLAALVAGRGGFANRLKGATAGSTLPPCVLPDSVVCELSYFKGRFALLTGPS